MTGTTQGDTATTQKKPSRDTSSASVNKEGILGYVDTAEDEEMELMKTIAKRSRKPPPYPQSVVSQSAIAQSDKTKADPFQKHPQEVRQLAGNSNTLDGSVVRRTSLNKDRILDYTGDAPTDAAEDHPQQNVVAQRRRRSSQSRPGAYAQPGTNPQQDVVSQRRQSRQTTQSRPGAYAQPGPGSTALTEPGSSHLQSDLQWQENSVSAFSSQNNREASPDLEAAVARAVDGEEPNDQPAEELKEGREEERDHLKKRRGLVLGCCALGLLVVIAIVVSVALATGKKEGSDSDLSFPSVQPTSSPSTAPTSAEPYLLSLLPDYSMEAIQDPASPQAKAFQWMLNGLEYSSNLSPQRIVQRFGLVTLFFATNGIEWSENTNWLSYRTHECQWYNGNRFAWSESGAQYFFADDRYMSDIFSDNPPRCNASTGLYEHLWLDRNNLNGPIPLEIYLLTSLKTLSLADHTPLQGSISSHIGQLTALEGFAVENMADAGTIPTQIGLLTNMRGLVLAHQHTGTIPTELQQLTNLQYLIMSGTKSQLEGKIPDLRSFPKLRWLQINGGNNLSGTIPTQIGLMDNLEWISVGGNKLSGTLPSQIGMLTNLGILSLFFNQFEGTLPTQLGLLTASTLLSFGGNLWTGSIPSELGHLSTNLSLTLTLNDNPTLTGPIPTQLGRLSNLYQLKIGNNNLTGPIPSQLGLLQSLGQLQLVNNSFTGTIPDTLELLHENLYIFEVENNPFLSGTIPAALCNINGTCEQHPLLQPCIEGTNMTFDCTGRLCGCDCPCGSNATDITV